MFYILLSLFLWVPFITIWVPLCLLGWVFVPVAAFFREYGPRKSRFFDKKIVAFYWCWLDYVWGNDEDGIDAGRIYKDMGSEFRQIVYWSCFRNPVNNLRFIPILSAQIKPERVKFFGTFGDNVNYIAFEEKVRQFDTPVPQYFFAWCGVYSNFFWQFRAFKKLWRFWVGWKVMPADIYGVSNYRKPGAGFALQFKRVKENG